MRRMRYAEPMRHVTLRMPESAYQELKRKARDQNRGIGLLINALVLEGLNIKSKAASEIRYERQRQTIRL